jgi:two-component system phosphate regulon sensor histidine kinase PhoR
MNYNKEILNSLEDALFIFTKELLVLECNTSLAILFNTKELAFPISSIEINRNLDFQNFLKKSVRVAELSKLIDFSFDSPQTSLSHFYDISCLPLNNSELYLCTLHNITDRKKTEQIKEDFISNFSHEIKTPLTVLHGHIQLLKNEIQCFPDLIPALNSTIQKIEYNSNRMINLFNDLLLLTSVEKKSAITKDYYNVEDNITFLAQDLLVNYPNKRVQFIFKFDQKFFYIDLTLFEQILINLIDNSLKYGTEILDIKIATYEENNYDVITIEDSGPGIPANQLHRIYERFYRCEISHSNSQSGTGLGLAIVKHIVQLHDAKIHVLSTVGIGTKFTLHFKKSL